MSIGSPSERFSVPERIREAAGVPERIREAADPEQIREAAGDPEQIREVDGSEELIELLTGTDEDLVVRLVGREFELPPFELEGRDLHVSALEGSDTRLVLHPNESGYGIRVIDGTLELQHLSLEFTELDDEPDDEEFDSHVLVQSGSFAALDCAFECESELACFRFSDSDAELIHCDLLAPASVGGPLGAQPGEHVTHGEQRTGERGAAGTWW